MTERRMELGETSALFVSRVPVPSWGAHYGALITHLSVRDRCDGETVTVELRVRSSGDERDPGLESQGLMDLDTEQLDALITQLGYFQVKQAEYRQERAEWEAQQNREGKD